MKIHNSLPIVHNMLTYPEQKITTPIEMNYADVTASLEVPTQTSHSVAQSNEQLLLLLQGTSAYTGYLREIAEQDILTDAEKNYLLSGDMQFIEKKKFLL